MLFDPGDCNNNRQPKMALENKKSYIWWTSRRHFVLYKFTYSLERLYVDDSRPTLSEQTQPKSQTSNMPQFLWNLFTWTADNHMQINSVKIKEIILSPLSKTNLPVLKTSLETIQRVSSFKLLGVHVASSLCWSIHINGIAQKAATRLYLLKQLIRSGLSSGHLLYYNTSVTRPVLEYCVNVWYYALSKNQSQHIERIQKRAIHI